MKGSDCVCTRLKREEEAACADGHSRGPAEPSSHTVTRSQTPLMLLNYDNNIQ